MRRPNVQERMILVGSTAGPRRTLCNMHRKCWLGLRVLGCMNHCFNRRQCVQNLPLLDASFSTHSVLQQFSHCGFWLPQISFLETLLLDQGTFSPPTQHHFFNSAARAPGLARPSRRPRSDPRALSALSEVGDKNLHSPEVNSTQRGPR